MIGAPPSVSGERHLNSMVAAAAVSETSELAPTAARQSTEAGPLGGAGLSGGEEGDLKMSRAGALKKSAKRSATTPRTHAQNSELREERILAY